MRRIEAEAAGHAATGRFDHVDLHPWDQLEHCLDGRDRIERLLVTMTMQQSALLWQRSQRQCQPAGAVLRSQELLEQECSRGKPIRIATETEHQKFVAQR